MDHTVVTNASHNLRDPQTLGFQRPTVRRTILASYWIVIFLAIPFWWRLTSIERKVLPSNRVQSQLERRHVFPVNVQIEASSFRERAPVLASELTQLLTQSTQASSRWRNLDVHVSAGRDVGVDNPSGVYTVKLGDVTEVRDPRQLIVSQEDALSSTSNPRPISLDAYDAPSAVRMANILTGLLAPAMSQVQRVAQYSKRYRLAFTLLNENAASNQLFRNWDVRTAVAGKQCHFVCVWMINSFFVEHLSPLLSRLNVLHEFVIESQIQFHAPLAFEPTQIVANNTLYGLTPADLTVFVNSAEWTLSSSVSDDPVLHFVLFVPSASRQPLHILDAQGSPTMQTAFLLPQWGGIYIFNPSTEGENKSRLTPLQLKTIFSAFADQLSALLGIPSVPDGVKSEEPSGLTDWQLDTVLRYRTMENIIGTRQTLYSIVKLVDRIENMPVDEIVRGDVDDALTALDQAYRSTLAPPATALKWSSKALSLASHAFFNPDMLALLYFPAEHKYAVYTPLFASIAVPLLVALGREFFVWRRERQAAAGG